MLKRTEDGFNKRLFHGEGSGPTGEAHRGENPQQFSTLRVLAAKAARTRRALTTKVPICDSCHNQQSNYVERGDALFDEALELLVERACKRHDVANSNVPVDASADMTASHGRQTRAHMYRVTDGVLHQGRSRDHPTLVLRGSLFCAKCQCGADRPISLVRNRSTGSVYLRCPYQKKHEGFFKSHNLT